MTGNALFIYILLIHYLADFGLQTNKQATGKGEGKNIFNKWLFFHVGTYSIVWLIALLPLMTLDKALVFATITFFTHYTTDWLTSRIGKPFWENKDFHNGFAVVGFDQILHYVQLLYTFSLVA